MYALIDGGRAEGLECADPGAIREDPHWREWEFLSIILQIWDLALFQINEITLANLDYIATLPQPRST